MAPSRQSLFFIAMFFMWVETVFVDVERGKLVLYLSVHLKIRVLSGRNGKHIIYMTAVLV